ncbi:hypothetical protein Tco_0529373 [Tanacetum coccineum]
MRQRRWLEFLSDYDCDIRNTREANLVTARWREESRSHTNQKAGVGKGVKGARVDTRPLRTSINVSKCIDRRGGVATGEWFGDRCMVALSLPLRGTGALKAEAGGDRELIFGCMSQSTRLLDVDLAVAEGVIWCLQKVSGILVCSDICCGGATHTHRVRTYNIHLGIGVRQWVPIDSTNDKGRGVSTNLGGAIHRSSLPQANHNMLDARARGDIVEEARAGELAMCRGLYMRYLGDMGDTCHWKISASVVHSEDHGVIHVVSGRVARSVRGKSCAGALGRGVEGEQGASIGEEPLEIVGREVKRLKRSRIPLVKVRWNSKRGPEFTWERKDQFKKKYPHLFTETTPSSSAAS